MRVCGARGSKRCSSTVLTVTPSSLRGSSQATILAACRAPSNAEQVEARAYTCTLHLRARPTFAPRARDCAILAQNTATSDTTCPVTSLTSRLVVCKLLPSFSTNLQCIAALSRQKIPTSLTAFSFSFVPFADFLAFFVLLDCNKGGNQLATTGICRNGSKVRRVRVTSEPGCNWPQTATQTLPAPWASHWWHAWCASWSSRWIRCAR